MKIDQRENLIERYLLGELKEADQTSVEQELLTDKEKFEQVWAIENEMIDRYVRGEMSGSDRQRFEDHYLASPLHRDRVAIAEIFITSIDQLSEEPDEDIVSEPGIPWWSKILNALNLPATVMGGASVVILLFILGAVWTYFERARLTGEIAKIQKEVQADRDSLKQHERELVLRNQELEKEIAGGRQQTEQLQARLDQLRRQRESRPTPALSFLLTPASVRNENMSPPPIIPLFKGEVRILMELESNDYQSYQIRLQTDEGREVLRKRAGKIGFGGDREFADVTIPTRRLAKGDYVLVLSGQTANGRIEEIGRYFFQGL